MKNDFMMAINQVCHERQLPTDIVLEAVEVALISAYKRNFSENHVTAQIEPQSGEPQIFIEKAVVETVEDEKSEITLKEAKKINPQVELGGLVSVESTPANFGRIAAQTAKQVILQRIREAERDALYSTYVEREGEIVNGTVHKIEPHQVTLSLGKVEAFLPRGEQIPTESYSEGQRLRAYVATVSKGSRGPHIIVSRTHRNMLRRLLEVEVPEIYNGTVEIKSIAREAGYRSKVAVAALQEGVDPVGSCVGMRGTRIQNIVNELSGEKIDVVQWNPDLSYFIANSLSPARVMNVMLDDINGKTAVVVVPDKQLSLAIGKEGQNARLAAKLTNWRIDIKSASEAIQETLNLVKQDEAIRERVADRMEIFNTVAAIIAEKEPIEYTDGELNLFSEAIEMVNLARMALENEFRIRKAAEARQAAEAIDILSEAEAILSGEMPKPSLPIKDEERLAEVTETAETAVEEETEEAEVPIDIEDIVAEAEALLAEVEAIEAAPEADTEPAPEAEAEALVEPEIETTAEVPTEAVEAQAEAEGEPELFDFAGASADEWEDDDFEEDEKKQAKKKARQKKRRLVYDERLGEVVSERRRKRTRRGQDWLDYDEDEEL
ncbi:MAG: transcription termination/antitermination protein NusA [Anaerolineae bacterium]|nr:transcription termination/antitermination protein NusA [Anaerolineae bacterium]